MKWIKYLVLGSLVFIIGRIGGITSTILVLNNKTVQQNIFKGPFVLRGQKIEIYDKYRNKVGAIEDNMNRTSFSLFATDGQVRAEMWVVSCGAMWKENAGITLYDAYGNTRATMLVGQEGEPELDFYDKYGKSIKKKVLLK